MDEREGQAKGGWRAAPAEAQRAFTELAGSLPGAEMRRMFGCACALINGRMFAGAHEQGVFMRLSDEDRQRIEAELNAGPFEPLPGRRQPSYVVAPLALLQQPDALLPWLEKAHAHTGALPPEQRRKRKKRE